MKKQCFIDQKNHEIICICFPTIPNEVSGWYNEEHGISIASYGKLINNVVESVGQFFSNWLNQPDLPNEYYVYINGRKYVNCDTNGFVNWLNPYFLLKDECASVVKQHTKYKEGAPKVDF